MANLAELDELLGEARNMVPASGGRQSAGSDLILFGAGLLGRTMLAGLRKIGIEPAAFADDTPGKRGTVVDGVRVLAPADAANRFGPDSDWVVTILNPDHRYLDSQQRLQQMGCRRVSSFLHLAWQHPDVFLPYYQFDVPKKILQNGRRIRQAFALMADDESRRQFLAHLRFRLGLDFSALPPMSDAPYFPRGLVLPLPDDVVFVDCGAYTGDTIRRFLEVQGEAFGSIVAIEPDRANFGHLAKYVASLEGGIASRIRTHHRALGERQGTVRFNGLGNMSAAISDDGTDEIPMMPLDRLLSRERHMYIKFDIEGAELDALKGCRELLRETAPLLAVCVYHRPDDLWDIPVFIHETNPDYRFFLTTEGQDGMDVVCYAVADRGAADVSPPVLTGGLTFAARQLQIERYDASMKAEWDDFIARSKNGVFLFQRDYLEYHADRFADHSLLFRQENKLVAVLPANLRDCTLYSHGGLTFGGFVTDARMRTPLMLELFASLKEHLRAEGVGRVHYKAVPHIYHQIPAEEDLYALFVNEARLVRRDVSSTIRMSDRPGLSKGRKWSANRARKSGVEVRASDDFERFMAIEAEHLRAKFGVQPTHTAEQMRLLVGRYPGHIKLFGGYRGGELVGGVIVYESAQVAHAQYIAATPQGQELAALDAVLEVLLDETYAEKAYFDFGISTERGGRYLNEGLINYKESYGARAIAYDHYELEVAG